MEAETHYADSGGVSIAYQVHGSGPVDLVLVPGFVSHVELLGEDPATARFLRRLAAFSRLLVFDKRGQGLSDRPGRPPTLEESMDDLRAVVEAAGFERPAVLGISEGGPMSALYAATYPGEVAALILFGTFARMVEANDFPHGISDEQLDRWGSVVRRDWGGPVALDIWAPSRVGDGEFERWWARLLRQGTSPAGAIALMDLYREMDVRAVLPAIDVPTLVLHRVDDRMISVDQGRYLAASIPGARLVELPGNDHLPFAGDVDAILGEVEEFLVGSRETTESERALATILFTDIVGSTEKAAELGDRGWRQLLERHDAAVRHQLALYRGREVKTMGDGFLATFDGPARAIRCASAVQDEGAGLGIEVRAGIHTGEVELIGEDVGGMAVNIGARIGALADPGEVLVSSTVRELVVGSGLEFEERGVEKLKGAPGEWRLFATRSTSRQTKHYTGPRATKGDQVELSAEAARLAGDPRDRATRARVAADMDALATGDLEPPPSGERKIFRMSKSASSRKTLLEPGHEAEWAEINREKREYHQEQARRLTPSERVAQGQKLSQQAVQVLASTIRRGHVSSRAFWS